jgi:hypothetical protein
MELIIDNPVATLSTNFCINYGSKRNTRDSLSSITSQKCSQEVNDHDRVHSLDTKILTSISQYGKFSNYITPVLILLSSMIVTIKAEALSLFDGYFFQFDVVEV